MVEEGITDFRSTASFDDLLDEELEITCEGAFIKKAKYLKGFSDFEQYF